MDEKATQGHEESEDENQFLQSLIEFDYRYEDLAGFQPWGKSRKVPHIPGTGLANRDIANRDVCRQPVAKKIAKASGAEDFNVLQNNGAIAHQVVGHVSFS